MRQYLEMLRGGTTEIRDLLGEEFVEMFDSALVKVDQARLEEFAPSLNSMAEAMELLGLNTRMFEYTTEGATAELERMKNVQELAEISLRGLDKKSKEYADTKKNLAKVTAQENIYTMYQEIAAMQAQGATVAELAPKYEQLSKVILATAQAVFGLNRQATKSISPLAQLWERIGDVDARMEELTAQAIDAFATGMAGAMESAINGTKRFGDSMKEVFRDLLSMIGQYIAKLYIMQAIDATGFFPAPVAAAAQGLVSQGGFSSPVPLAQGGVVSGGLGRALPLKAYANGGIISGPHVALMGEAGRDEAVVPLERMSNGDLGVRSAGGGANVNISINAVDARGVDELLVSRQDTLRNIIRQAMLESRSFRSTMLGQTRG